MNESRNAVMTDYEEVPGEAIEKEPQVPAPISILEEYRHPLKEGTINEQIKKIKEETDIDEELGLTLQKGMTLKKALESDIDDLTSSEDYFQVSKDTLKKLFQIKKLNRKCLLYNLSSFLIGTLKAAPIGITLHLLSLLSVYPLIRFNMWIWPTVMKATTPFMVTLSVLSVLLWIGLVVTIILGFADYANKKIRHIKMSIDLKTIPLKNVLDPIPYGAKLKVLEAKKTKIFNDFVYATPEFSVENIEIDFLPELPPIDPAILGVTADQRMFMIVYWDIEKDAEKVTSQIKKFKKFKLNKV